MSDERGKFRIELLPGRCRVSTFFETEGSAHVFVDVRAREATHTDVRVDHDALIEQRKADPPLKCPSSASDAIVDGHTTPDDELNAVARAVLERYLAEPSSMPDAPVLAEAVATVPVLADVWWQHGRELGADALPRRKSGRFSLRHRVDLQAEADRTSKSLNFVQFESVHADGNCAVVEYGTDLLNPTMSTMTKACCCTAQALYDRRDGAWMFVRRVRQSCS